MTPRAVDVVVSYRCIECGFEGRGAEPTEAGFEEPTRHQDHVVCPDCGERMRGGDI